MNKGELIPMIRGLFKGRNDIVAVYWESQDGSKGYKPLRDNLRGENIPLSDILLQKHIEGKIILGVYPLMLDNSCTFVAADFDNHKGELSPAEDIKKYYQTCCNSGIPCYVFRSKSGLGYHVYIFFKSSVEAAKARSLARTLLSDSGILGSENTFDRLFPSQDELSGKKLGNLIALPFQGRAMVDNHTMLLDPESGFQTCADDQILALKKIRKISLTNFINLTNSPEHKPNREESYFTREQPVTRTLETKNQFLADFVTVYRECSFIAHCKDDAETLPYMQWWVMVSNVVRCHNGKDLAHQLSSPYPRYNKRETERLIANTLKFPYPITCEYIENKITDVYCKTCQYQNQIRYPVIIGIDLALFADGLSFDEDVNFDPELLDRSIEGNEFILVEDDYQIDEDWSINLDDMESDDWESYLGGPDIEDHDLLSGNRNNDYDEESFVYLNKYMCSNCFKSVTISSDIAKKIIIMAHCRNCGRYGKLIHWKAFKYRTV